MQAPTLADHTHPRPVPAGVLVPGTARRLREVFPALVALQPTDWTRDGLVCAPRSGDPSAAADALRNCPVPWAPLDWVPAWHPTPARWIAGWYLRSDRHAPAPSGIRELIQATGEGFGPHAHPTTEMCLAALADMPCGPAVDVGCGSGLLSQAWYLLRRGSVVGVDVDPAAVRHARDSLDLAGIGADLPIVHAPLGRVLGDHPMSVWLVNLPPVAHRAVHACMHPHSLPAGILCSGFRASHRETVLSGYRAHGLRTVGVTRRAGWECWRLRP